MASPVFEWRPARMLQSADQPQHFALLVLNQPLRNGINLRRLWRNCQVCRYQTMPLWCHSDKAQSNLQVIIGDLDSLTPAVRDFYSSQPKPTKVIRDADQESTDFGKAINWIRSTETSGVDIVALGGIGGRVDQGLSQLHHLYLFQPGADYAAGRVYLLSGASLTFLLKAGAHRIHVWDDGEEVVFGKHVGIIPLKEPSVITTRGLEWDVADWETQIGGKLSTSNHVRPETKVVEVKTSKDVLFTIALSQPEGVDDG